MWVLDDGPENPRSRDRAAAAPPGLEPGFTLLCVVTVLTPLPSKYLQQCYLIRAFNKEGYFV